MICIKLSINILIKKFKSFQWSVTNAINIMSNEVEFLYRSVEVNTKFQLLYVYAVPEGDREAIKQTG
jgi:hypothetical protein